MSEGEGEDRAAATIPDEVPCAGCGYNLRGLSADGACPECGHDRGASIDAEIARRATHWPVDRAWARHVVEGIYSLLVSFALTVAVVGLARWSVSIAMFARHSPGRYAILAMLAAAWVAGWYGVWKMTPAEPGRPLRAWFQGVVFVSRWARSAYFLVPFVWGIETWERERSAPFAVALFFYAGTASQLAVAALLSILALRAGRLWLAGETVLFLIAAVGAFVLTHWLPLRTFRYMGPSSLDLLVELPSLPLGSAAGVVELLSTDLPGSLSLFRSFWFATSLLPIWGVAILVRLLVAYRDAARTGHVVAPAAVRPPAAGGRESRTASSHP